jgi:hypothetical protein
MELIEVIEENLEGRALLEKIEILKLVVAESSDPQLKGLLQSILDRYVERFEALRKPELEARISL